MSTEPEPEPVFEVSEEPSAEAATDLTDAPQKNDDEGEEVVNILDLGIDPSTTDSGVAVTDGAGSNKDEQNEDLSLVPKEKKKKKPRPARVQIDPTTVPGRPPPQTGTVYNIWYNKWSGGEREDKYLNQTKSIGRCNIARDSGYTRADKVPGSFFCILFARGLCPNGKNCNYLHRLPVVTDIYNPNVDCFGRDKRADYRDDMGGVGSFLRHNRTIYVGRISVTDDIEEQVARHFAEWGDIERIRVLNARGVAFVTYVNEINAEFAKEAMAHQSLENNEILNVRWATADPNPLAKAREQRKIEEQAAEAVRRMLPPDFLEQLNSQALQVSKKRRTE